MFPWLLIPLAAALGVAHVVSEYHGSRALRYALKAGAILPLVLLVVVFSPAATPLYRHLVTAALLLCMIGDALLVDRRRLVPGLVAFLFAHLLYAWAFASVARTPTQVFLLLPLLFWGGAVFLLLRPALGRLQAPVFVYILALLAMIWCALSYGLADRALSATLVATGAVAFGLSDTVLAIDRFRRPFRAAQTVILLSYYAAQILLAMSVAIQ